MLFSISVLCTPIFHAILVRAFPYFIELYTICTQYTSMNLQEFVEVQPGSPDGSGQQPDLLFDRDAVEQGAGRARPAGTDGSGCTSAGIKKQGCTGSEIPVQPCGETHKTGPSCADPFI